MIGNSCSPDVNSEYNSGIDIEHYSEDDIKELYIVCKIWGLLKYYHPNTINNLNDWDDELFKIVLKTLKSNSENERDDILLEWIKNQGEITSGSGNLTFEWISGTNNKISEELFRVVNSEKEWPDFEYGVFPVSTLLTKEKEYIDLPPFPDTGYRLLTLFRYWNVIEYFFPYKHFIDNDWDEVLLDFIPKFIDARNAIEYRLLILELITCTNDSHAFISDKIIYNYFGERIIPIDLGFVENNFVVVSNNDHVTFRNGDVISMINDTPIDMIVEKYEPYIPASHHQTKMRDVAKSILRTNDEKLKVTYLRDSVLYTDSISTNLISDIRANSKSEPLYEAIDEDIIYISLNGGGKDNTLPSLHDIKGVILDMRKYPNNEILQKSDYFNIFFSQQILFAIFDVPILPGVFELREDIPTAKTGMSYNAYRGKLILLVDINTQSFGEFLTMKFQNATNSMIIGTPTAGANGDVIFFSLPGGIKTGISGLGVYYPDGAQLQRIGIVPDVHVDRTIEAIKEDRDELLEKAIDFIYKDEK